MRHLLAFNAASSTTYPTAVTPVGDLFPTSGNGFVFGKDQYITAVAACGTNITRCELHTPSIGAICDLSIFNLNSGEVFGSNPGVQLYNDNPIKVNATEALSVNAAISTGTTNVNVFIEVTDGNEPPVPPSLVYTVRGTATATLTANAWTSLGTITWEQAALPAGNYLVTGCYFYSATALAGRIYNATSPKRPGGLGYQAYTSIPHPYFLHRGGRSLLTFNSFQYPNVEMFATAGDTAETVILEFVKTS